MDHWSGPPPVVGAGSAANVADRAGRVMSDAQRAASALDGTCGWLVLHSSSATYSDACNDAFTAGFFKHARIGVM